MTTTKTPRGLIVSRAYLEQAYQEARAMVRAHTSRIEETLAEGDLEHVAILKQLQYLAIGKQEALADLARQYGLEFATKYSSEQGLYYPLKKQRKGGQRNDNKNTDN